MKQKVKVLVVDDDRFVCSHVKKTLESDEVHELHVDVATSPLELPNLLAGEPYRALILDNNLGPGCTAGELFQEFGKYFPEIDFPHEETLKELNIDNQASVSGKYLLPMVRRASASCGVIMLTGELVDQDLADYARAHGASVTLAKHVDDRIFEESPDEAYLDNELLQAIDELLLGAQSRPGATANGGSQAQAESARPRTELSRALQASTDRNVFKSFEETLVEHGRNFDLITFLETHIDQWPAELKVRGEILYYNPKQKLLEQISHVGFEKTRRKMRVRPIEKGSFEGICAYTAFAVESVLSPNVLFDTRFRPVQEGDRTKSELAVPLCVGDDLIGVLNFESDFPNTFTHSDLMYFEKVSSLIGQMVENDTFREEEVFLQESCRDLSGETEAEEVLKKIFFSMLKRTGGDNVGCVLVPGRSAGKLKVIVNRGLDIQEGQELDLDELGVIRSAAQDPMRPFYWTPKAEGEPYVPLTEGVEAEYAMGIGSKGHLIAVIDLESKLGAISERFQSALTRLAREAFSIIERLEVRGKMERESATRSVLEAISVEAHNLRALFRILLDQMKRAQGQAPGHISPIIPEITRRLARTEVMAEGFLAPTKVVSFNGSLDKMLNLAQKFGISISIKAAEGVYAMGTEVGVQWMLENMILNTMQHVDDPQKEGWFTLEREGETCRLSYWDNGSVNEDFEMIKAGAAGGKGIANILMLCKRYGWYFDVSAAENGSLLYVVVFPEESDLE